MKFCGKNMMLVNNLSVIKCPKIIQINATGVINHKWLHPWGHFNKGLYRESFENLWNRRA